MKKIVMLVLLSMPFLALAQQQPMTALFENKEVISNLNEKSFSEFTLIASEDQMNSAKEEAEKYAAYMSFEVTPTDEDGKFSCLLTFNHKGFHQNVHKMLLTFGVERFIWKEQVYNIDSWFNVFN